MKLLYSTITVLSLVFAGISILLYIFQDKLIFFPQKIATGIPEKFSKHEIFIDNNGVILHGWFVKGAISKERPLIIYYGGNAEEVSGNLWDLDKLSTDSFLFMNYRGYGKSQGKSSEKMFFKDALFIFDRIRKQEKIDLDSIIIMGRSLGSGVAVYVAKERNVQGVILVTPFDSILKIAQQQYPMFPVSILLKHKFNSLSLAPSIQKPALFLMGSADTIIPNKNSQNLLKNWGGSVQYKVIQGASHNNIANYEIYWQEINTFLELSQK